VGKKKEKKRIMRFSRLICILTSENPDNSVQTHIVAIGKGVERKVIKTLLKNPPRSQGKPTNPDPGGKGQEGETSRWAARNSQKQKREKRAQKKHHIGNYEN